MFPVNPTYEPLMSPIHICYKSLIPTVPLSISSPYHSPQIAPFPSVPGLLYYINMASASASGNGSGSGSGSPCGACKFLRRKCAADCIFAPYFCSEQGAARFAAIHKVFGASNVSKLLLHIPAHDRCEAVVTIAYEAQARIRDPVYGCVSHIFALQQQVACLQAQLMQVKSQLAQNMVESRNIENQWPGNYSNNIAGQAMSNNPFCPTYMNPISPQSSLESIDHSSINDGMSMHDIQSRDDFSSKKRSYNNTDLGELQELALRMMRN
ncbi:hypothetical protein RJT34_18839 [Clitoria ternatea]|uniref:LOB domain-containing protein n=1 Tax=Clitoria ternatea TaxID=43366 RepID=A0AAN9IPY0_CLITE